MKINDSIQLQKKLQGLADVEYRDGYTTVRGESVFPVITDDPVVIGQELKENPPMCMILNSDLHPIKLQKLAQKCYIFAVFYKGEERLGQVGGFFRNQQQFFDKVDPQTLAKCSKSKDYVKPDGSPESVFAERLSDPQALLLSAEIKVPVADAIEEIYEVIDIKHNGTHRKAVPCVQYDPFFATDGRVVSQHVERIS